MRGELVICKDALGRPLVRRVWEVVNKYCVTICNPNRYDLLVKAYDTQLPPLGWPREDVYHYDPQALEEFVKDGIVDPELWKQLKRY